MHYPLAVVRSMASSSSTPSGGIFPLHILGCGPIGLLYASMLHEANDNDDDDAVTLLLRSHHGARLSRHYPPPARRRRRWSSRNGSDDDADLPPSSSSRLFAKVVVRDNTASITTERDIPAQLISSNSNNNTRDKVGGSYNVVVVDPIRRLLLCTKANDAIDALEGVWERLVATSSSSSSSSSSSTHSSSSLTTEKKEKNNRDVGKVIILSNGALAIRDAIYKRFGCDNDRTTTTTNMCDDDDGRIMIDGVHIVLASTTHGAYRNNPSASLLNNNVVNKHGNSDKKYDTNNDELYVGYYDITHAGIGSTTSSYVEFCNACRHSSSSMIGRTGDVHSVSDVDMELALWRKLAANCVVNPLTAIHDVRNGALLDKLLGDTTMRNRMRGILKEVSDVAIREMTKNDSCNYYNGNSDNDDNSLTSTTTTSVVEESLSVSSLEEFTFRVMYDTRNNISSMLQDVKVGRITEIQYLNGYITSLGKEKYDLDCPYNAEMCRLLLMGS